MKRKLHRRYGKRPLRFLIAQRNKLDRLIRRRSR